MTALNVVSELRKAPAGRANSGVVRWASSVPSAAMFLSVISAHELDTKLSQRPATIDAWT